MFSHVMVGTNDPEQARKFYDATFGALGIAGQHTPNGAFYGSHDSGMFGVTTPRDGQAATHANGGTVGINAPNQQAVDAWHKAALDNGGSCEGPPGRRDMPGVNLYGAYARDPVGNKLCAFCVLPEGQGQS